jgi:hypothetical protein
MSMFSKFGLTAIALAAIVAIPGASYAAFQTREGAPSNGTGLTNPGGCQGGGCTSEKPDRMRQPCLGGSCYKRTHTKKSKSSAIRFEVGRAV